MSAVDAQAFLFGYTSAMRPGIADAAERLSAFADMQTAGETRKAMKDTASHLRVAAKALDALSTLADADESPRNKAAAKLLLDRLEYAL